MRFLTFLALALSCAVGAPERALANGPNAGESSAPAADTLFRQGREAFDKGDYQRARDAFAESQRLEAAPGTLLNLALAEEKLGTLSSAWEHAKEVLDG